MKNSLHNTKLLLAFYHLQQTQPILLESTDVSIFVYLVFFIKELHEKKIPAKVPEKKVPPPKGMFLESFK